METCVHCDGEFNEEEMKPDWAGDDTLYCSSCAYKIGICSECGGVCSELSSGYCESCYEFNSDPDWKSEEADWDDSYDPDED